VIEESHNQMQEYVVPHAKKICGKENDILKRYTFEI
jgi:hypothetical protein